MQKKSLESWADLSRQLHMSKSRTEPWISQQVDPTQNTYTGGNPRDRENRQAACVDFTLEPVETAWAPGIPGYHGSENCKESSTSTI